MRALVITTLMCGAALLGACKAQTNKDAQDVLNMENDAQAVPVNGGADTFGTSTTGAAAVQSAPLRTGDGKDVGSVSVREEGGKVVMTIAVQNMKPGKYGMHIHEFGKCEGPKFASAGGHWNPDNKQHGTQNPQGSHAGDLPNLEVGPAGSAGTTLRLETALRSGMTPLIDKDGSALVIHAGPDDMRTDPSGNSGDRVACAVIGGA